MEAHSRNLFRVLKEFGVGYRPIRRTMRVRHDPIFLSNALQRDKVSRVELRKRDTLEVAELASNPLVLILADHERPGGNFKALAGMQEESLFLRSALWRHLTSDQYPIAATEALYATAVPLLDGGVLSFVACPGLKLPRLIDNRLSSEDEATLQTKIELILQIAHTHGHDDIVLGALGCGVWGCPPRHVAEVFRDVLERYAGLYATAYFAVLGANFDFFADVLGCSRLCLCVV